MKTRSIGVLAIVMAMGCAHGQGRDASADARDGKEREHERAARDVERDEPRAVREEQQAGGGGEQARSDAERPDTAAAYGTEADNTRVNERDRESSALTPMDQSESESDRDLLQRIRRAVIADDSLSFTAKNIKIITRDGQVTLRGAVNNENEKATIEKTAVSAAGPKRVTNELEVSK